MTPCSWKTPSAWVFLQGVGSSMLLVKLSFLLLFFQPGSSLIRTELLKTLSAACPSYWGLLPALCSNLILSEMDIFPLWTILTISKSPRVSKSTGNSAIIFWRSSQGVLQTQPWPDLLSKTPTLRILCYLENLFWGPCVSSKFCLKTNHFFLGSLLLCIHYQNKLVGIHSILPGNLLGQVCNVLTYCTALWVSTNILPFQLCLTRQSRPSATCLAAIELSAAILVSYYWAENLSET